MFFVISQPKGDEKLTATITASLDEIASELRKPILRRIRRGTFTEESNEKKIFNEVTVANEFVGCRIVKFILERHKMLFTSYDTNLSAEAYQQLIRSRLRYVLEKIASELPYSIERHYVENAILILQDTKFDLIQASNAPQELYMQFERQEPDSKRSWRAYISS